MRQSFFIMRHKDKGNRWYAHYLNPATGEYDVKRSIVKLYESMHHERKERFNRQDAYETAKKALSDGLIRFDRTYVVEVGNKKPETIYFNEFCLSFWDYDNSDYIRRKNRLKPNSISYTYASESLSKFRKHVRPYLPDGLRLEDFDPYMMNRIRDRLVDSGVSNSTINKVMSAVRLPLENAYDLGYVKTDVASRIRNVPVTGERYGNLTRKEVTALLDYLDGQHDHLDYERWLFLMVSIALWTGMRQGEIRALQMSDFEVIDDEDVLISVTKSWNEDVGLKTTKNGKPNISRIPFWLYEQVREYAEHFDQEFIFFNPVNGIKLKVVGQNTIIKEFRKTLVAIGISDDEIKRRKLGFHSLRATSTSIIQGKVSDEDRMKLLNHTSLAMTMHYTHETVEHMKDIGRRVDEAMPKLERGGV